MPIYPAQLLPASGDKFRFQDNMQLIGQVNEELSTAWKVMRRFCLLVNLGTQTQGLIDPEIMLGTMSAVLYRLLRMDFSTDSLDEVIRLGLLAFSQHVFLQWHDMRTPYYESAPAYRNCLLKLTVGNGISSQLMVWLLMAGAISLFDIADEVWLAKALQQHANGCQITSWKGMQETLKSFMWIPLLDERRGKQNFDLLDMN